MTNGHTGPQDPDATRWRCVDGNEAAARVAYALSEVIAIYPITPASPMGEQADVWQSRGKPNLWGQVPDVVEMQSEGGAAGALHGAVQKGALATTFTASQGLLLMLPNMYKIAGELTPAVIHVAARTIATHALSIFGDHSDVMGARQTGWAMLASASVQEAQDLAAVAHAATLVSRVPFLHFFDGFRTSHEINKIALVSDDDLRSLINEDAVTAHRMRALSPERPVLRGSAQNPDVFFQAREAANPYYDDLPRIVQDTMDAFAERTGRHYHLADYHGAKDAERVLVLMGSASGAAQEAVDGLVASGERVGVVTLRLYRPFPAAALLDVLPGTVTSVAVLDRTKEPGAVGEPLYTDVMTALAEAASDGRRALPRMIGGRYGLSSKEFTPAMAKAVLDELRRPDPRRRVTAGIVDDVGRTNVEADESFRPIRADLSAVIYGLGSDGTVGASKNTVKIVGEDTDLYAQGYFEYDSRKAGATTTSHLRFSSAPIRSTYLIEQADLVAVHQFSFLERYDVLGRAREGAKVLINSPHPGGEMWRHLPVEVQDEIVRKRLEVWTVDAQAIARELRLGARINTVMQPCFFKLAELIPSEQAVELVKSSITQAYGRAGSVIVERNHEAVDRGLAAMERVETPASVQGDMHVRPPVPAEAPDFVQRVTARILAGQGHLLPVSALPVDGTFPVGTARWEKRQLADEIPIWDPDICIDCGKCAIVCPHATIRMKVFEPGALDGAPANFLSKEFRSKDLPGHRLTIQVAPDDCTGCGICVEVCPAHSKQAVGHKAINMRPAADHRDVERPRWEHFLEIPELDRSLLQPNNVKGSQAREPLFEFSSACPGCGETPYLKLLTQLYGDRLVVANATGCSSIYGGTMPTTPWSANAQGRGPAWSNSLFEDNAEFGFGIRLAHEHLQAYARDLLRDLSPAVGHDLAHRMLDNPQETDADIALQRELLAELMRKLDTLDDAAARRLGSVAGELVSLSVWIVGGDGWAYDIGFGGLDHVIASGRNVNLLVLDTEAYSNTGGQASKATQRGAAAKFAISGKRSPKKDLGLLAMTYGDVYVAQVAMGASDAQTVRAFTEAQAWPGPSLILAYSTCIVHGIGMATSMDQQRKATQSGYWPLFRYHPGETEEDTPLQLDSRKPSLPLRDFALGEGRFATLARSDPEQSKRLLALGQADVDERWRLYNQLAEIKRRRIAPDTAADPREEDA